MSIFQITLRNMEQIHRVSPSPTRQDIQLINNETQSTLCWTILQASQDAPEHFPSGEPNNLTLAVLL